MNKMQIEFVKLNKVNIIFNKAIIKNSFHFYFYNSAV